MVCIIAEVGINHNGSMAMAKELIRQAAIAGADVAKFQAYSVDALFGVNGEDPNEEIYKGVKPLEFNKEQFAELKAYCDEEGIEFMASVFDEERLGWMEDLGVKRHKIASRTSKLTRDLAEKIVATGKECFMSLGFDAKPLEYKSGTNIKYLYCVAKYPTMYSELQIPSLFGWRACQDNHRLFVYEGFSDHSLGIEASLVAVGRGANVIEKHFTLNKGLQGFDHVCSMTPDELKDLVSYTRRMEKVLKYC
jgi:N-acetylneuraminate synthase/N,N'-diacetyllegionaminate synthase